MFRAPSLTNEAVVVAGDAAGAAAPAISPSQTKIVAFTSRDGINLDLIFPGGERWRAHEGKLAERHFAWSPDGTKLAFRAEEDPDLMPRRFSLMVVDVMKRSVEKVSDYLPHLGRPMWRKVGNELEVYAPWDGDTIRRRYAIDGELAGAVTDILLVERNGDIWLEREGAEPRQMTLGGGVMPQLSPDGTRFLYQWADAVYVASISETLPARREPIAHGISPRWSPNGTRIALCVQRDQGHDESMEADIYLLDMTQPNQLPVQLTNTPKEIEIELEWSSDALLYYSVVNDGSLRRAEVK